MKAGPRREGAAGARRRIPSVDAVLRRDDMQPLIRAHGRALVTRAVREALDDLRRALDRGGTAAPAGGDGLREAIERAVSRHTAPGVRRVINATGVVVHTNLGRAVLSKEAHARAAAAASSYCTLEYDLERGERGSRSSHLERRLSALFPGHAGLAVNNNAAAVFLALNTLAEGRDVVISRGELVEIGGSFRIPEILERSGARLREVGTTNRTRLSDYEAAIGAATGLILKVHRSNYRIVGFTEEVSPAELSGLAARHGLQLLVDQGSGNLLDLAPLGLRDEPTVASLLSQGSDLVTFSGDKLLGGPQAGLAVGRPDIVERMRKSPLYRVLRLDKMTIAAMEATLDAYVKGSAWTDLPVPRMIGAGRGAIGERAARVAAALRERLARRCEVATREGTSRVGGGAAPMQDLPTVLVTLSPAEGAAGAVAWERRLRAGEPPVIARIQDGALQIDLRTVDPAEEADLIRVVAAGAEAGPGS